MRRSLLTSITLFILTFLSGCSEPASILPSTVELTSDTGAPYTEATFLVTPPAGTVSNASISLVSLDTIAGLDIQMVQTVMTRRDDGRFEAKLTVPVGSILTYRYIRTAPSRAPEVTSSFEPVSYRVAYITGPTQVEETIAGWTDLAFDDAPGRIIGRVINSVTGEGQPELLVSAGGRTVFSEIDGAFRIDGLALGIHQLTIFSPDGAFIPVSQGALVAAGTTTPVELEVRPATPIFVTFQLTVPEGLSPDAVVRLAGNISTFGNRFNDLMGGMLVSVEHMPSLVRVDPQHFLAVISLYAGTDLRYKYTLGDGLWNAERAGDGSLLTRQVILPAQDLVLRDSITSWGNADTPPVRFILSVPETTPVTDHINIQFKPTDWFEPLPMWPLAPDTWYYDLYGPLDDGVETQYRYCRNAQCGTADDADTAGPEASGRELIYSDQTRVIEDEVHSWRWLEEQPPPSSISGEPVPQRAEVLTGVEFSSEYRPSWRPMLEGSFQHIRSLGADSVILPVNWLWTQQNPFPLLELDAVRNPMRDELGELSSSARQLGLELIARVNPIADGMDPDTWWETAALDRLWWELWFEEYRQFALSTAEVAADLGIDVLILGGKWTWPALPGGTLKNGGDSGAPADAEDRWRSLIADVRSIYPGRVAFELALSSEFPILPEFLDSVDAIVYHWEIPASVGDSIDVSLMVEGFVPFLDLLDSRTERFNRPLWIILEYASVQGGATVCPPAPDGTCRPISLFERGQDVDPDLQPSFEEQTSAINAVLLAAHDRRSIQGIFIRGFDPSAVLWDKSSSIYGKPAEDVLRYWYPRINGE